MNAAGVCKLRNGVKKALISSFFYWPKAVQRPWRTCELRRDRVFEAWIMDMHINDCKLRNERKRFNPGAQ
jgi:hypothetical protein